MARSWPPTQAIQPESKRRSCLRQIQMRPKPLPTSSALRHARSHDLLELVVHLPNVPLSKSLDCCILSSRSLRVRADPSLPKARFVGSTKGRSRSTTLRFGVTLRKAEACCSLCPTGAQQHVISALRSGTAEQYFVACFVHQVVYQVL